MKKIITLCLALSAAFALDADAQWRKTWDFTQGYSEETKANLIADTEYWKPNRFADDEKKIPTGWADIKKMSGELKANGVVIEELRGLSFSNDGLSNTGGNYLLDPTSIRMSRANNIVYLPKLTGGQTVTFIAKSANSTKTDRGFAAVNEDSVLYEKGPAGGLCLGGEVEDPEGIRAEDGTYTLVWRVRADITDSIEVAIKILGGGCDIKKIYIDEGDQAVETVPSIALIFDSTDEGWAANFEDEGGSITSSFEFLQQRIGDFRRVDIDASKDVSAVDADSLKSFDLVVVTPYLKADAPILQQVKGAIAFTPVLNLTPEYYTAWGYGSPVASASGNVVVKGRAVNSPIFASTDPGIPSHIAEDGTLTLFDGSTAIGYSAPAGSYFAADSVLAYTVEGSPAIHMHNMTRNAYLLMPYADPIGVLENSADILPNAMETLIATKRDQANTGRPLVSQEYHHLFTTVTLTPSTSGAAIYYTTDGSTPTTESTLYTEPFDISQQGVTVKAVSLGDGFLLSDVVEQPISIYELATAPTFSVAQESGKSTVTIIPAQEGDVVYYNITGSADPTRSSVYTTPIVLTKHATITAFTADKADLGQLQSELVEQFVEVQDEKVRLDVIAHFDANRDQWSPDGASTHYYVGRNGYAYYTEEFLDPDGDGQPEEDESGNPIFLPKDSVWTYNPMNGWQIKTHGQPIIYQSLGIADLVGDPGNYNPASALDADGGCTANCVQFATNNNTNLASVKDPASASLETTVKYQGPFDIVAYLGGNDSARVEVFVSTDTLVQANWQKVGEVYTPNLGDKNGRTWQKNLISYEGTDEVFVKLAALDNATIRVFDVYLKNAGEESADYVGIEGITTSGEAAGEVIRTEVYSAGGARLTRAAKGLNIIKEVYADGSVKARKVVVK